MISLTCTHCKAQLNVDEAFAGGACRCQHCGTIQTVPRHLKGGAAAARGATQSKTLYTKTQRASTTGTGLDDLVGAVTSSGLSSGRLRGASPVDVAATRRRLAMMIGVCVAVIVILIGAVGYVFWSGPRVNGAAGGAIGSSGPGAAAAAKVVAPNFCGIPLSDADTVVYCLDRGDSARDLFGYLKSATYRSIGTLGAQRKFQIVFWNNGSATDAPLSYPKDSPALATQESLNSAQHALDELTAQGKTDVTAAFEKAVAVRPAAIILATAKAWDLDDSFVATIQRLRKSSSAKIHTVALTDPGQSTALKSVAQSSGGEFRVVGESDLRETGQ
jgi:hypothetical protein